MASTDKTALGLVQYGLDDIPDQNDTNEDNRIITGEFQKRPAADADGKYAAALRSDTSGTADYAKDAAAGGILDTRITAAQTQADKYTQESQAKVEALPAAEPGTSGGLALYSQGIVTYTHAKTGTTHALTGPTGAKYLTFVATASFTDGDTFTVNGTAVTAKTIDGAALYTGDFVSGQAVSVALEGSVLTFQFRSYHAALQTKANVLTSSDALFTVLDTVAPSELHRTVFRGRNLGTALTSEQKANIQNGTFEGLWLGDYWVIGGRNWRIVDIDYWLNCGDTSFTKHHLVIMPDKSLYAAQMNETNITTGGYFGSKMYTTNLANAKTLANSAFPNSVLSHRELITNAVTNGYPSGGAWYDSTVELPNEIMMYGSHIFMPAGNGTTIVYRYTTNNSQLALMAACPKFIKTREAYWLRDVVSAASFAYMDYGGNPNCIGASTSLGVRPVFPVG